MTDPTAPPARGRRVTIAKAGGYDRLALEDFPVPALGPSDVHVGVAAIGVNYADVIVRMGLYASAKELVGWPITPGFEVSGVVRAVGSAVTDLAVGDEVFAVTLFNGYASELVVDRRFVFPKPAGVDHAAMAGMPAVFMTAWYAIHELAHPRPGAKALVHSAAGGVGGSLVQLLKVAGCEVVGVVGGAHKVATARDHGADHVIDKSSQDLWAEAERHAPDGYDVVFDANGVATLKDSYSHLARPGKLVVYGFTTMMPKKGGKPKWLKLAAGFLRTPRFSPLEMTQHSRSVMAFNLSYLFDRIELLHAAMSDVARWLAEGRIHPAPVATYPLDEVARAHADIESGRTVGKLVLLP